MQQSKHSPSSFSKFFEEEPDDDDDDESASRIAQCKDT